MPSRPRSPNSLASSLGRVADSNQSSMFGLQPGVDELADGGARCRARRRRAGAPCRTVPAARTWSSSARGGGEWSWWNSSVCRGGQRVAKPSRRTSKASTSSVVGDGQRRQEAQHVAESSGGQRQDAVVEAVPGHRGDRVAVGVRGCRAPPVRPRSWRRGRGSRRSTSVLAAMARSSRTMMSPIGAGAGEQVCRFRSRRTPRARRRRPPGCRCRCRRCRRGGRRP